MLIIILKKYVLTPNPAYVDFTDLGGDCTNFVSQVLRAGAMSFTATSPNPNYLYWYYYNSTWGSGRTSTWTSAHDFRQHWGEINNIGMKRAYKYTKYTVNDAIKNFGEIHSALWPGDVIQHVDSNGNTYHSQAVYIISANDIIVGQHTYNIIRSLKDYLLARQDAGYGTDWVCIIQIKKGP